MKHESNDRSQKLEGQCRNLVNADVDFAKTPGLAQLRRDSPCSSPSIRRVRLRILAAFTNVCTS